MKNFTIYLFLLVFLFVTKMVGQETFENKAKAIAVNIEQITNEEKAALNNPKYFYEVEFDKPGSLMMPIIAELQFEDGTSETHKFPVQIWRRNNTTAKRVFATEKKVVKIQLDPKLETADIDVTNNTWPKEAVVDKFEQIEKK